MSLILNGIDYTAGIDFSSSQYALQYNQLIADIYNTFKSQGYYIKATSAARSPALGSQSWTISVDNNFLNAGAIVIVASNADPLNTWWAGVVTAASTSSITVNVSTFAGATIDTNWNICPIGALSTAGPGSSRMGETGQTTAAAALSALGLDTPASIAQGINDDFCGASYVLSAAQQKLDAWDTFQVQNGSFLPNAAPYFVDDYASHPGVIGLQVTSPFDEVALNSFTTNFNVSAGAEIDLMFKIPAAFDSVSGANFSVLMIASTQAWGLKIGASNALPMRLSYYEQTSFPGVATDTGFDFLPGIWYRVKAGRGYIRVFSSEQVSPQNPITTYRKKTIFAQTGISTLALTNTMGMQIVLVKSGTGTTKNSILIDYVGFTPPAPTR